MQLGSALARSQRQEMQLEPESTRRAALPWSLLLKRCVVFAGASVGACYWVWCGIGAVQRKCRPLAAIAAAHRTFLLGKLEAPPGFEPGVEVLQTSALPLGDGAP